MPAFHITFAKIVGSPTQTHWSHVYTAGSVFVVLSLSKKDEEKELSLNVVGKGILNNIEAEFFALEEKNLASIKEAITNALESTPEDIAINLCLAYNKNTILYLFVVGSAKAMLKRNEQIATILSQSKSGKDPRMIHAASGELRGTDTIILQTHAFTTHVTTEALNKALAEASPTDSAELLAPHIHQKEAGDAAAIIMHVASPAVHQFVPEKEPEDDPEKEPEALPVADEKEVTSAPEEQKEVPEDEEDSESLKESAETGQEEAAAEHTKRPHLSLPVALPALGKKQLVILVVAVILALILGASIYSTKQHRLAKQTDAHFKEVYDEAAKEYDLGTSLEGLNKSVAQDDFIKAQKILKDNEGKFPEGSDERKQLDALLAKVNDKLGGSGSEKSAETTKVDASASPLLTVLKETHASYAAVNDADIFYLTDKAIIKTDKTAGSNDTVYKNDNDWSAPAGLGAFGSNIYVLDRKAGILKFVAGSDGYGKQNYVKGTTPNLSNAVDMAIDGSVWILEKDGTILKYTKGEKESFSIQALQQGFKNPTRIYTNADIDNLYIVDAGNNRIVMLDKNGTFKNAYSTSLAASAKGIDVDEKAKKLYLLSGDSVYELSL